MIETIERLETLYRTKTPDQHTSECYELVLRKKPVGNQYAYFLKEVHGWWDDPMKEFLHKQTSFAPDDGYPTQEEALDRYNQQRSIRAKDGFIYSFTRNPWEGSAKFTELSCD